MVDVQELSGAVLEGYQLDTCVGSSSHTAVYRARRNGAQWAVKVFDGKLEPDGTLAERLRREAGAMGAAQVPRVLPIVDAGRSGKLTFTASRLVRAQTLREMMRRGLVRDERSWAVLSSLAGALDQLHGRGFTYRALRPEHVLVDDAGIHLAEVGAASSRVGPLMLASSTYHAASPQYLAPEQIEGAEPDRRTDVYAFAVLVFEILTGTHLYGSRTPSRVLSATLAGRPPSAYERQPGLPRALDEVLVRGLARRPEDRPASAGELLAQMLATPDEPRVHLVAAAPPGPPAAPPPPVEQGIIDRASGPGESMLGMLRRTGIPLLRARYGVLLDDYFALLIRQAREVCRERWVEVAAAAGLLQYAELEPPAGSARSAPLLAVSQLAGGIEAVFGTAAMEVLRQWGRTTTELWIRRAPRLREGDVVYRRPFRLRTTTEQRVEDALRAFTRDQEHVRGEPLTAWKRVDPTQLWVVHHDNLTAVGRRRLARACGFSTGALEQALRWGGCANEWIVEEVECGCVTGTYDCVFTIRRTGA